MLAAFRFQAASREPNIGRFGVLLTLTNSAGQYSFPAVPPGTYSVKATHLGFSEFLVPQVVIEVEAR